MTHIRAALRQAVHSSVQARRAAGAELFVNDYWELALEFGAGGAHLGQEDLLALGEAGRAALPRAALRRVRPGVVEASWAGLPALPASALG